MHDSINVKGTELQKCSSDPLTGWPEMDAAIQTVGIEVHTPSVQSLLTTFYNSLCHKAMT